jgi:ring-1,2-phenylacetyl-CoA epoxidase subunit PaaC
VTVAAARESRVRYLQRLADTSLVLAQRLGEWVGHAPAIEEDLGLANTALDLLGQARLLLSYAGELEGRGRDEDALAFLREEADFYNVTLAEQPNGDFGDTIVRQFLIDAWQLELYERLQQSSDPRLAEIAAKAVKETRYHARYSAGWLVRLGDGTEESHARVQAALERLWPYTRELLDADDLEREMSAAGIAPDPGELRAAWLRRVETVLAEATLERPADVPHAWYGKQGRHSEHLGHLLAEMQYLQRTHPGAHW